MRAWQRSQRAIPVIVDDSKPRRIKICTLSGLMCFQAVTARSIPIEPRVRNVPVAPAFQPRDGCGSSRGVVAWCARRSWHDPTGGSPVRVRHSEPPGNECCGRRGNAGSDAYTVIAWGVGLSHEMTTLWRPRPSCQPKATCVAPLSQGAIAPPGSVAISRAKGSCRNLGDPAASAGVVTGGGGQRGTTEAGCTAAGSRTGS